MEKFLVIRLSSLGDILLTTPLIRALKKKYPLSKIDFITKSQYLDVIKFNPNINQTIEYSNNSNFYDELKKKNYDIVIDLQNNFRSLKITVRLKAKVYRFNKHTFRKFFLVNFKLNLLKNSRTIPERYAKTIPNLILDDAGLEIHFPHDFKTQQNITHNNLIGFCPGSRHFTKRWLPEYFIELGKKLVNEGYKIVLFGGKDDKEICKKISQQIPDSINLQNENKILETAFQMKHCKLIITNDSGLMHTATAVRVPVLVIFGSSVKEFGFTPYKTKSLIIERENLSCRPCSHIGKEECPKMHFRCMKDLTPELVYEKFQQFIKSI
ncbi:MAG: lipopolysaccharide heptosyltransferase II [Melioribacter sp.]|nr:lipopolysaccharide heptosyltransferase II [Melioribacter sp.]